MGFIPPLNLGNFQPSPATLSQWIYQIWQYLQENPIATQEQIQEFIGTFITTSPETQEMIGEGVQQYLVDNPPQAPVQSVQGKTGAVQLAYNEIVPASNAVPVYRAASTPSTNTLVGQYNLGYRLFVNTATQEIFTITPAGALSLVGRGKFDGTTVDLNTAEGDTTIAEALASIESVLTASIETPRPVSTGGTGASDGLNGLKNLGIEVRGQSAIIGVDESTETLLLRVVISEGNAYQFIARGGSANIIRLEKQTNGSWSTVWTK